MSKNSVVRARGSGCGTENSVLAVGRARHIDNASSAVRYAVYDASPGGGSGNGTENSVPTRRQTGACAPTSGYRTLRSDLGAMEVPNSGRTYRVQHQFSYRAGAERRGRALGDGGSGRGDLARPAPAAEEYKVLRFAGLEWKSAICTATCAMLHICLRAVQRLHHPCGAKPIPQPAACQWR